MSGFPDGWGTALLGALCRIELGKTPARANARLWDADKATNNVWLSISDMPDSLHAIAVDSREYVADAATGDMRLVPEGALLVSFKLTLGRLCYAGRDLYTNEAIAALLELDRTRIIKEYLYWYLTFFDWEAAAKGDEKVKGKTLNKEKLKVLPILLPPLDEQKRIVAKLDQAFAALDRARVNAERNLKETELLYEASVDAKINGGRVGWQSGTIQSLVGDVFTGPFGSLLHKRDYVAGGTPIVNPSNIVGGTVEPDWNKTVSMEGSRRLDSYKLRSGDLVLGRRGEMGRCAPISEEMDGWLCGTGSFIIRPKVGVSVAFVGHLMRSRRIVDRLSAIATGATMPNLSNQALAKMSFELPEKPQQIRLLAEIERLQETAESLGAAFRSKLADITALRQSLLQAAFSGQLS